MPKPLRLSLRRRLIALKRLSCGDVWPICEKAGDAPGGWPGWPASRRFALVLTHDVDTARGHERCLRLAEIEERLGFRSSFNFVPEGYRVSAELRRELSDRGFEVGVHGLKHDGRLYESKRTFLEKAERINGYLRDWGAVGFRSPAMHHNLDWLLDLDIEYDASTFDTDPFEPQPDGMETIYPFIVRGKNGRRGYVELPYTLPQDFTLFVLMAEKTTGIWRNKLGWIAERGGMALMNTHPDYMSFGGRRSPEEYPVEYYREFLECVKAEFDGDYWHALPKEMSRFIEQRLTPERQEK
jgi:peptidoglycan/xylan/chitin deacetylase (PgdA/CDA1 family)